MMRCAQLLYSSATRALTSTPRLVLHARQIRTATATSTATSTGTGTRTGTALTGPRLGWRALSGSAAAALETHGTETTTTSQGNRRRNQRTNESESTYTIFKASDETEFDSYQLDTKPTDALIAIMSTLWVKFSNGAKALNIWNNIIYPRIGTTSMSVEEALQIVPILADLKQYHQAIEIYEAVLRPRLRAKQLRASELNAVGPHTYRRGNYSRPGALPSLFHALFTRVAMSEFPSPQTVGAETTAPGTPVPERTRTADEVRHDAELLLELWSWVYQEDQATKPTARYLRLTPRDSDHGLADDMPSKQLLNVTRVKEQTTITLSAHKAAKLLNNARALEQIMDYIPQRNWRIVRNTYEILIKEAVGQGRDGALKAAEQFQTLCRFGVSSPPLFKVVIMALREHNRHQEIVHLAHQLAQGEITLGRLVPDRATLNAVIHACYETHQTRAAMDFWHFFVRQYEQRVEGRAISAASETSVETEGESETILSDKDKEQLFKPYFSTIEKYLSMISSSNSPVSEADKLLKTLKTHFAPVSASAYAGMLRIAARAENIEFAIALWTDMKQQAKQQNEQPNSAAQDTDQGFNDAVTYASMAQTLLLLLAKHMVPEAWTTRAEMIVNELTQLFNTNITHSFVNAIVDQALRRNFHPETLLDMVTSLIKITGKYPTEAPLIRELFDQAAKLGRAELALALFATLKDVQSSASAEESAALQSDMYSTLLLAYARSHELDRLTRVMALMKQQNITPTEAGYNAVLEAFKEKDIERGADLVLQYSTLPAQIYAAVLEALLNENKLDKAAEVFAALHGRESHKIARVSKTVLRRLSTALTKDKSIALRNAVMPHLRAAITF